MAHTPKELRKWVKDEKRIVKLLYQKGFLKDSYSYDRLYWEAFRSSGRKHRHGQYRFTTYYPEIHYCTSDYWGEYDDNCLTLTILDILYWEGVDDFDPGTETWPKSKAKIRNRQDLLKHLKTLPTVVKDSKINKILRLSNS